MTKISLRLAIGTAVALSATPAAAAADGPALYKRCSSCHLPTGTGVPGAFPPLGDDIAMLAEKPDGRRFLVLVVTRGVAGPIIAAGKPYRGVMPAQSGLDDAAVAAVLNHILDTFATAPRVKRFAAGEVAEIRKSGALLTPKQVGELQAKAK